MKTYLKPFITLLLCIAFLQSCKDKPVVPEVVPININCTEFTNAVVANDLTKIETLVNAFFASRKPVYNANEGDEGYGTHFKLLLSQINACSTGIVSWGCYMCYQTYPATTIIRLEQPNNSQAKKIQIDIHSRMGGNGKPTGIAKVITVTNY